MRFWILLLVLGIELYSCSPNSLREFKREGESRCRSLVLDLEKIESRQQLLLAEPQLRRHFESLISLMMQARTFEQKHLDVSPDETETEGATRLEEELRRIYAIEGGREVIERAQHEALVRLDACERALAKKREQLTAF
jgi:hypothetical protein